LAPSWRFITSGRKDFIGIGLPDKKFFTNPPFRMTKSSPRRIHRLHSGQDLKDAQPKTTSIEAG